MDTSYFNLRAVTQAMLAEQLSWFKAQLHKLGIVLIGDLPLYLAYDSAEVWAHQEYFDLDKQGRRLHFAGVPPDAFCGKRSALGQSFIQMGCFKAGGILSFYRKNKAGT